MLFCFLVSFVCAFAMSVWCILKGRGMSAAYDASKPQRFHVGQVPRLGGLAVIVGLLVAWALAAAAEKFWPAGPNTRMNVAVAGAWALAVLPAFAAGLYEDISQQLGVRFRLALTALSATFACWALGLGIARLGIAGVDEVLLAAPWLGVALAFLAIAGLPHAFNLIDGYNGLAGTVALLISLAIAHVALQVGDRQLAAIVVCLAGATAGFLVWNYPRGLLFAGDGGAYLWGVVIAMATITLVQRHSQVSPWFPFLLLIYPVWETIFSIYRKLARGVSPGVADALHFHQLIYRRVVRSVFHDSESRRVLMRNNRTSPYLWSFTALSVAPALLFWNNTPALMMFCLLFVVTYVVAYLTIIRFKVPRWIKR
jgi:UDP-GlcNAc:undecaprenyl-phosphate/decaprenyl-phosphate GlcNAc-1-phosphate transferase